MIDINNPADGNKIVTPESDPTTPGGADYTPKEEVKEVVKKPKKRVGRPRKKAE